MTCLNLDSKWFRCYSRALLTDDLDLRRIYVMDALNVISEALSRQDLEEDERKVISVAANELHRMERERQKEKRFLTSPEAAQWDLPRMASNKTE